MIEDAIGEVCHGQNIRATLRKMDVKLLPSLSCYHSEILGHNPCRRVHNDSGPPYADLRRRAYSTCRMRLWAPNERVSPYVDWPLSGRKIFSSKFRSRPSVANGRRLSYAGPLRLQSGTTCYMCRTYTVRPSDSYHPCADCNRHECQKPERMFRIRASDNSYPYASLVRLHTRRKLYRSHTRTS